MSDAKNEQGQNLARLRELALETMVGKYVRHGKPCMTFPDTARLIAGYICQNFHPIKNYISALEQEVKRLAAIVDGMTVVEVGACDGNPGASGCPCYAYGDGNDDWCLYLDNSLHGKDLPPHDCPLKSGPVLLKLKD